MSEAPKEAPVRKYLPSSVYLEEKTDEQKKDEVRRSPSCVVMTQDQTRYTLWWPNVQSGIFLMRFDAVFVAQLLSAMVSKLGNMDDPLPQDSFEGVDEDEWVSECGGNGSGL